MMDKSGQKNEVLYSSGLDTRQQSVQAFLYRKILEYDLSAKEVEILGMMLSPNLHTPKQIVEKLNQDYQMVYAHIRNLYRKTGCHSMSGVVRDLLSEYHGIQLWRHDVVEISMKNTHSFCPYKRLSKGEKRLVYLLLTNKAKYCTNKQLAKKEDVAVGAIGAQLSRVYKKLRVNNRVELIKFLLGQWFIPLSLPFS